ncbi:hypothetical protein ACJIZ3_017586 [Penstemon smallii]|uniref:Transcription repressor n=1 Tax=Penstemon smallii TaxID=265156 RepID=A0ABD3SVZ4_9LAMI
MSNNNILWKSFSLCFSKFKCLPSLTFSSPPPPSPTTTDQKFTATIRNPSPPIIKNFNSMYDLNSETAADDFSTSSDYDSDTDTVPDFSSAFASHRFFFSSPGSSNSILEPPPQDIAMVISGGGLAVQTYSPDPYGDFRKSMQEMIEDRKLRDVITDWDFLHELLLCYLSLNPKHTHKFIVAAFADVIVSFVAEDTCRIGIINQRHCAMSPLAT